MTTTCETLHTNSFAVQIHSRRTGRLQIQNDSRQIIGYVERDGTVTNTHRQPVGTLEELRR